MKNPLLIFLSLIIIFIVGCAPTETVQEPEAPSVAVKTPVKVPTVIGPAPEQEDEPEEVEVVIEDTDEVEELLFKAEKVSSISYRYKGPETADFFYKFFQKGNSVRYIMDPTYKDLSLDDDSYESVFLNKETQFAGGYCLDKKCKVKGKKATLKFGEANIKTPFDWLDRMGDAKKLGEEILGKRQASRLQTENAGIVWVDNFYGVPLQVEFEGNLYQFTQMVFNSVKDSDVIPS
jgi:hypothetical protein